MILSLFVYITQLAVVFQVSTPHVSHMILLTMLQFDGFSWCVLEVLSDPPFSISHTASSPLQSRCLLCSCVRDQRLQNGVRGDRPAASRSTLHTSHPIVSQTLIRPNSHTAPVYQSTRLLWAVTSAPLRSARDLNSYSRPSLGSPPHSMVSRLRYSSAGLRITPISHMAAPISHTAYPHQSHAAHTTLSHTASSHQSHGSIPSVTRLLPSVTRLLPSVTRLLPSVTRLLPSVTRLLPSVTRLLPSVTQPPSRQSHDSSRSVTRLLPSVTRLLPSVTRLLPSVTRLPPISHTAPPINGGRLCHASRPRTGCLSRQLGLRRRCR